VHTELLDSWNQTKLRRQIGEVVDRVAVQGRRIVITRHSRPYMAMVPLVDLQALEKLDEQRRKRKIRRAKVKAKVPDVPAEK